MSNPLPRLAQPWWNVETVIGVSRDNNDPDWTEINRVKERCTRAYKYGLVNIVRLDWKRGHAVARTTDAAFGSWKTNFWKAVESLNGVAKIFVVGNEPLLESEGTLTSSQYAASYNSLYGDNDKIEGNIYLVAGPAGWSTIGSGSGYQLDVDWLKDVVNLIEDTDGFALHTYGSFNLGYIYPQQWYPSPGPNIYYPTSGTSVRDQSFRLYRNYLVAIRQAGSWNEKPVYLTEFNTKGFNSGPPDYFDNTPLNQYWKNPPFISQAYEEIRNWNSSSATPKIWSLCWFVDDWDGDPPSGNTWKPYALSEFDPNDPNNGLTRARNNFVASITATGR